MTRVPDCLTDVRRTITVRAGERAAAPARLTLPTVSAVVVIGAAAIGSSALGLPLALVLAITVAVAVAGACVAHRAVGSVLAGVTLLVVRPYAPGEQVRLRSPHTGELVDAEVVRVGLANTTLCTDAGLLVLSNSRLLGGGSGVPEKSMQA